MLAFTGTDDKGSKALGGTVIYGEVNNTAL
jgi:hypothetical protein